MCSGETPRNNGHGDTRQRGTAGAATGGSERLEALGQDGAGTVHGCAGACTRVPGQAGCGLVENPFPHAEKRPLFAVTIQYN